MHELQQQCESLALKLCIENRNAEAAFAAPLVYKLIRDELYVLRVLVVLPAQNEPVQHRLPSPHNNPRDLDMLRVVP